MVVAIPQLILMVIYRGGRMTDRKFKELCDSTVAIVFLILVTIIIVKGCM